KVAELWGEVDKNMQQTLGTLLQLPLGHPKSEVLSSAMSWLLELKQKYSQVCDWVGIYFLKNYLYQNDEKDLILGPFLGEATPHVQIPLNKGLCGLAVSQGETINFDDVTKSNDYLACSLATKSEIVIPIRNVRD